jgi:hypothetical protein
MQLQVATGRLYEVPAILGPSFPDGVVDALPDPILFAELNLLAARRARAAQDFSTARDHLDRALASTLTLQNERFDAARLIIRIVSELIDNYDTERAFRIFVAAGVTAGSPISIHQIPVADFGAAKACALVLFAGGGDRGGGAPVGAGAALIV